MPSDGISFVNLYNANYIRKTNINYFHWQYFDSPFESRLFTAFDYNNKLIGYLGLKLYPLSCGIQAGFVIDILVDEKYRKMGIASILEGKAEQFCLEWHIPILCSFPNAHGNATLTALGWKSLSKIDSLFCFKKLQVNNDEIITLKTNDTYLFEILRNNVYREWRFEKNPLYTYHTVYIDDSTFAVTKLFSDPLTKMVYRDIVDIAYSNSVQKLNLLLFKIIQEMDRNELEAITTWALPHTQLYKLFIINGYTQVGQERYFCIKLMDQRYSELNKFENWNLVQSDTEIY